MTTHSALFYFYFRRLAVGFCFVERLFEEVASRSGLYESSDSDEILCPSCNVRSCWPGVVAWQDGFTDGN